MTATNHAIMGAIIVAVIPQPLVSLPLAFVSHFVLDSLPHAGGEPTEKWCYIKTIWVIDSILLLILFSFLYFVKDSGWYVIIGAMLAESPDLAWVYRYAWIEKWGKLRPKKLNAFNQFHSRIQKYEFKNGIYIEIVWLVVTAFILNKVL